MGKKPEKSIIRLIVHLDIGEIIHRNFCAVFNFYRVDWFKLTDVEGADTAMDIGRSPYTVRGRKQPNMPILVHTHHGIVMGICSVFIQNGHWSGYLIGLMVKE